MHMPVNVCMDHGFYRTLQKDMSEGEQHLYLSKDQAA